MGSFVIESEEMKEFTFPEMGTRDLMELQRFCKQIAGTAHICGLDLRVDEWYLTAYDDSNGTYDGPASTLDKTTVMQAVESEIKKALG